MALAAGGWVHAAGTAEIALGLIIAAQRNLDRAVLQQHEGVYKRYFSRAVADSRVTVVGVGKIGGAVISRLAPFEVELTRVASHAREDEAGRIHGIDELDEILPRDWRETEPEDVVEADGYGVGSGPEPASGGPQVRIR